MIKKNKLLIMLLTAALFLQADLILGQQSNIDSQFKLAVDLYQSGEYNDALPIFEKIATRAPYNSKTTIAYLFTGKTYLGMNELGPAKKYLQEFLEKFPESRYSDEAHLALVKVFYKQEDYKEAFEEILHLISNAQLSGYKDYAESLGKTLAVNYLGMHEIKTFNDITTDSTLKPYLLLVLALKQESDGNYRAVCKYLQGTDK